MNAWTVSECNVSQQFHSHVWWNQGYLETRITLSTKQVLALQPAVWGNLQPGLPSLCNDSGLHLSFSNNSITLIGGPAGRAGWMAVFPNEKRELSAGCTAVLFRIRIFGVSDPDFWRIFWIRCRIGYHFCSSRIRIRIIQNATLGKLFIFSRFDFFLQKFFDNLRLERSDAGWWVYVVV